MINANLVLTELHQITYKEVVNFRDEKTAMKCIAALVNCLYLNFRTRLMYIPSTNKQDKDNLNDLYQSIFHDFNGRNQQDLAIKYSRSTQNIYAIIKRQTKLQIRKNQTDIFPDELTKQDKDNRSTTVFILEDYLPAEFMLCGLNKQQATELSSKIKTHLFETFPGVSIYISEDIRNKITNQNQTSLF